MSVTRNVGPLSIRADVSPSSVNEAARTVDVVWTTGERVLRGFFDQFWEELSLDPKHVDMSRLNSGAPLLDAHNASELGGVIGVVDSARLEKSQGVATVRFAKAADDPNAEQIFRKVADGIIRNVSVGYRVQRLEKIESSVDNLPVYRATQWTPYEISMVPMGADAGAHVRAADAATSNPCVFVTRQERTMPNETETQDQETKPAPAIAATRAASAARIEDAKARAAEKQAAAEAATAAERVRCADLRKIAKRSGLGEEWAIALIEAGTSVDDARTLAWEEISERDQEFPPQGTSRISGGETEQEKFVRGASAWLFERTGTRALIERAREKMPEQFKNVTFDPGEFRGYSPVELARLSLERRSVSTRGMDPMRMIGLAFTHRSGNYQTIGDFPTLLENVLGKVLLGAYATQDNTWSRFCMSAEVADFRASGRYRTGSLPGLEAVPEHAEYTNGIVPDGAKYSISTQRYGRIFGLSRETIVNDDMGALTQMAEQLGRASMRTIETAVYDLLTANSGLGPTQTDTHPFFYTTRGNVNGTGSAIGEAGLDADRVIMRSQLDPNGEDYLDLQPAVLLVSDSLYAQARKINAAQFSVTSGAAFQEPNSVSGLFRDVVGSPRITGTRRYLFATTMDAIVVAFLQGYGRGPAIDSRDGWRIDGVEWKVSLYAKAQMGDPKAAVTNAGT